MLALQKDLKPKKEIRGRGQLSRMMNCEGPPARVPETPMEHTRSCPSISMIYRKCYMVLACCLVVGFQQKSSAQPGATTTTRAVAFDLADVQLLDGPFRTARDLNLRYLMQLEPDRLLNSYLKEAGLPTKGAIYGGWENSGISGTVLGHYMTALSFQYRSTSDTELLRRLVYIVDQLELCQKAQGDGYLAGIPNGRRVFDQLSSSSMTADQTNLNGSWAPWYVIHKEMSGLRDAWQLAGLEKARPMLIALADWVAHTTDNLPEPQLEKMMLCEFGGMNEILLDVFAATKNEKYRIAADRFYHNAVLDPLARREDRLDGLHANTQIPKIIGEARRYELLGEEKDKAVVEFFWDTVVNKHTYAMGGNSDGEHFGPAGKLAGRLGTMTAETCNTYHMLKLTQHVFEWDPNASYFDFYERALYNHIRASQEPHNGRFTYFVTLMPGHFRTYSTPFDAFWCCVNTGMENHTRYSENIYFHDEQDDSLFVNLYIPSAVMWRRKNLRLTQTTNYPNEGAVAFAVETSAPVEAAIKLRQPAWLSGSMLVQINDGPSLPASRGGDGYVRIQRTWKQGDVIRVTIPLELRKETMPDNPNRIALFYGPLMLAAKLGSDRIKPPAPFAKEHTAYLQAKLTTAPVLLAGDRPVKEWLELVDPKTLLFRTKGVGQPEDFELAPFYDRYYERYSAYLDNFTPAEWEKKQAAYKAENERVRQLEDRTVDLIRPGDGQMERDHNMKNERSRSGSFESRKWRDAIEGGWFSYEMKTAAPGTSQTLMCQYWGGDSGKRQFRITANGLTIAEPRLQNNKPGEFFREEYSLSPEAVGNNDRMTIRFEGHPGNLAGGLFELRVLHAE